jgi:hypothetical protein
MSTYQNQNQFKPTQVLGQLDLSINTNVKSVRIDPASVATVLTAGQAFKLVDTAGGVPIVDVAAITEKAYGICIHSSRKDTFVAGDYIDLACFGSVIYLEASAAIARGARVQNTVAGPTVALCVPGTNAQVGVVLDKATAAGQLVRVEVYPLAINSVP